MVRIDPFDRIRKNAHFWRGERALLWYCEHLDGSFQLLILFDLANEKRRLLLEADGENKKTEFKCDSVDDALFEHLKNELEEMARFVEKN